VKIKLSKSEKAWCMYDWANSSFVTTIVAAVLPVYFASVVCNTDTPTLNILGMHFLSNSQSLWGYAMSIAALFVAFSYSNHSRCNLVCSPLL